MRYRLNPAFWDLMAEARLSGVAVARQTPNGARWLYRIANGLAQSVSEEWMRGAVSSFPEEMRERARDCFVPLGERYTVKPALWGLLAMRRIKYTTLANKLPIPQQRLSQLRYYPNYTIDEATMRAFCAALDITVPGRYFAPAPARSAPAEQPPALLAS